MSRLIQRFSVSFLAAAVLLPGYALADGHEAAERGVVAAEKVNLKGKVVSVDAATRLMAAMREAG